MSLSRLGPWIAGAALIALPFVYRDAYHLHILIQILIWSFAYTSWSMMGRFGLVSLGHGGFMGIGGAFIMPATLSIITNVFPARERGKAIGVWAATAGLAGVLGPLTGGFLLEHFYWGSIFLVNIPIVVIGLLAGVFLIPTSKDPSVNSRSAAARNRKPPSDNRAMGGKVSGAMRKVV